MKSSLKEVEVYLLPVTLRVPLKFGSQVLTEVTYARVRLVLEDSQGRVAEGWGETPLSVAWVWPSDVDYMIRDKALADFTLALARSLENLSFSGHVMEMSSLYIKDELEVQRQSFNREESLPESLPHLAALVCYSAFDLALHDAYARLHDVSVYESYDPQFLERSMDFFLESDRADVDFKQLHLSDFLAKKPASSLPVWHLVGGLDPLSKKDLTGAEPDDGYPILLRDWIQRDGLNCLKVKLRGNDADWDRERIHAIGQICREEGVDWLTTDFNCMVTDPAYVIEILDELRDHDPITVQKILYVEQPFPYDLKKHQIDVHAVSSRKPLFMDESAHDWTYVRMGRELGWNGVALKTCKTQTGALLSAVYAKSHGMTLMVQDLTNAMLAQIPHYLLAAHTGTIMGVESNGMQFYPEASLPEEAVHPGLYRRKNGVLDSSTLGKKGFGYEHGQIQRSLPDPAYSYSGGVTSS